MFKWLRARVREAVLGGVQDAVDVLSSPDVKSLNLPEPHLLRLPAADEAEATEDEIDAPTPKRKAR